MITLRPATTEELEIFDAMDRQNHARDFVIQTGLAAHQQQFNDPAISYLSIENNRGELSGYFILVHEPDTNSVEFRRILIDHEKRGIGQAAIAAMECYCQNQFNAKRIWLDVYEDNAIGMHVYEKMGYQRFDEKPVTGRKLYFYQKALCCHDE